MRVSECDNPTPVLIDHLVISKPYNRKTRTKSKSPLEAQACLPEFLVHSYLDNERDGDTRAKRALSSIAITHKTHRMSENWVQFARNPMYRSDLIHQLRN